VIIGAFLVGGMELAILALGPSNLQGPKAKLRIEKKTENGRGERTGESPRGPRFWIGRMGDLKWTSNPWTPRGRGRISFVLRSATPSLRYRNGKVAVKGIFIKTKLF